LKIKMIIIFNKLITLKWVRLKQCLYNLLIYNSLYEIRFFLI